MKVRKTAALSLGTFMILSNGVPVYAHSNPSYVDMVQSCYQNVEDTIDTISSVVQNSLSAIEIETPEQVEEVSYTYVSEPVYYTVTETVSEPVVLSEEITPIVEEIDITALQAAYDSALVNYNAALAEYEAASQIIETTKEVEAEVVEETIDDQGNPVTETKTEIRTVTETVYAGDVETAKANLDAAGAALDAAAADLESVQNETVVVETEQTVTEVVQNAAVEDSGKCGDNLTWTLDDTGILTISGTGEMYNLLGDAPWNVEKVKKVVIKEGVTGIGAGAFMDSQITEITMPNSLKSIYEYAFQRSRNLKGVFIPDNVTYLGEKAFSDCWGLEKITLSKNLKIIDEAAFEYCGSLQSITIPGSVEYIYRRTFQNCGNLISVVIADGPFRIEKNAFSGCTKLEEVTIPASVKYIETEVFDNFTNLLLYVYPDSYALTYAQDNGMKYAVIGQAVQDTRHTLSMDGKISVNFYMSFKDSVFEDEGTKVEFKVDDKVVSYLIKDAVIEGNYRKFSVDVAATQMTTDILAHVIVNGEKVYSDTCTVKECCDKQLADSTISGRLRNLLEALLNYGGYAQKQFNYKTYDLANRNLANTDVSDVTKEKVEMFAPQKTGSAQGLTYVGSTLSMDTLVTLKHYFKLEDGLDIRNYSFISDDNLLMPVKSGNLYYVQFPPYTPKEDLSEIHYVHVGDFRFFYSTLSYVYGQLNKDTSGEALQNVCRALYKYYMAADEYF